MKTELLVFLALISVISGCSRHESRNRCFWPSTLLALFSLTEQVKITIQIYFGKPLKVFYIF